MREEANYPTAPGWEGFPKRNVPSGEVLAPTLLSKPLSLLDLKRLSAK